MASYYDTEVEEQKRSGKVTNVALPILAALEAIGTSIATKGYNPTSNALGIYKDVRSGREAALERALGRDKAKADTDRETKLLGFQEAEHGRRKSEYEREGKTREAEVAKIGAIKRQILGSPAELDPLGVEIKPASPGVADLTDLDKAAIDADPIGWLTNKLKPQSVNVLSADGGFFTLPKAGGVATPVQTAGGTTVKPAPKPVAGAGKTTEQIEAEAKARALGAAAAEKEVAGKTSIPGLTALPNATITNEGIKKVQDISIRKDELVKSIDRLQSLYEKHGTEIYGDAAREMESLVKGIQLTAKEFYNLGVLNGPDLGLMETMIANPTGMKEKLISMTPGAGDPVLPKLKEAKSLIDNRFKATINRYGFQDAGGGSSQVPEGTEKINAQGAKVRMTGGKWQVVQ
jgi:hypothetical protein